VNNCKNCKYFGDQIHAYYGKESPTGFHKCEAISHGFMDGAELLDNNDKATVVDGSGYFAAIRVKEDFGCVLFEEKQTGKHHL